MNLSGHIEDLENQLLELRSRLNDELDEVHARYAVDILAKERELEKLGEQLRGVFDA